MAVDGTRRRFLARSATVAAGAVAGCLEGSRSEPADAPFSKQLEERVPGLLERYEIPGASLALVEDGEVTWAGAYGEADPGEGRAMTTETLCRPQSITKSVTAWAVMTLIEAGELDLDDSVSRHVSSWDLPAAEYPWEEVTVRRLLSHSAGLPFGVYDDVSPDEEPPPIHDVLSGETGGPIARPTDEPGTFRYSNPGYVLLELLIQDVTGRDYAEYVRSAVLEPLGMDDATFTWSDRVASRLITEHLANGEPVPAYRESARAHGMLYATAVDVARFVAAAVPGPDGAEPGRGVLEPGSVAALHALEVETTGFYGLGSDGAGLGHFVETLPEGQLAVAHGGQGTGSWSWFHAVPETGDGIVILTNSERSLQFVADVVGEWADRRGLSSVGVSRAVRWARLPIWILWVVAAWLVYRVGRGLLLGTRAFAPTSRRSYRLRTLLGGAAVLTLGLWWGIGNQSLSYFLPVFAEWLGLALSAVALLTLVTVAFPRTDGASRR